MTEPCVFCAIVAGTAPATIVAEWSDAVALVPLGPVTPGHVLVIPRRHVADLAEDPAVTAATVRRASQWIAGRHESANIITSMGAAATQTVFHLHVHVVPRAVDDRLMVPWGTVYGDDPQAPHWCRVAQDLQERLDAARAEIR
ncbi:MAG TPA: HIT domain-containing protein [Pseudonocardia sp.]